MVKRSDNLTMVNQIINEIEQGMAAFLNNEQMERLEEVLAHCFYDKVIVVKEGAGIKAGEISNEGFLQLFLVAKRVEGCSEKSLKYYKYTIDNMMYAISKPVKQVMTEDLRKYLEKYQNSGKAGKITIDNIRRIFSSFFSWLE